MRNLDDHQFDEVFRQNLEPSYDKFDESAWEEMEQKLNGIKPKVKANKTSYMNYLNVSAMVALLGVSAIGFWQTSQNQKAIHQLSTELNELNKANVSTDVESVAVQQKEAFTKPETQVSEGEQLANNEVTIDAAETVPVEVVAKESTIQDKNEQKDQSEPLVASAAKTGTDHPGAEEGIATPTAKYYMLVDGEFIPVMEFDHPGAEQGDSAINQSLETANKAN